MTLDDHTLSMSSQCLQDRSVLLGTVAQVFRFQSHHKQTQVDRFEEQAFQYQDKQTRSDSAGNHSDLPLLDTFLSGIK
jgi:hypothetical protein